MTNKRYKKHDREKKLSGEQAWILIHIDTHITLHQFDLCSFDCHPERINHPTAGQSWHARPQESPMKQIISQIQLQMRKWELSFKGCPYTDTPLSTKRALLYNSLAFSCMIYSAIPMGGASNPELRNPWPGSISFIQPQMREFHQMEVFCRN